MNDDELKKLLREADRVSGEPNVPSLSAEAMQRIAGRRRRVRRFGGSVCVLIAIGAGLWLVQDRRGGENGPEVAVTGPKEISAEEVERLRAQIRRVRAEADHHMAVVRMLQSRRRLDEQIAELRRIEWQPSVVEQVAEAVDRAALIDVYHAGRLYADFGEKDSAIERYRDVVKRYPESYWASVAGERLVALGETNNGDM